MKRQILKENDIVPATNQSEYFLLKTEATRESNNYLDEEIKNKYFSRKILISGHRINFAIS